MSKRGLDREAVRTYDRFWRSRQRAELLPAVERVGWGPFSAAHVVRTGPPPRRVDRRCDVVVLGGGPTGMLIAAHLATRGHEVVVVERQQTLFSGTTWNIGRDEMAMLEAAGPLSPERWRECVTGDFDRGLFRLHEPGGEHERDFDFADCLNVSLNAPRFFQLLGATPGLELWTAHWGKLLCQDDSHVYIECQRPESADQHSIIEAKLLVDARGWTSPIARAVHPHRQIESVYNILGVQTDVATPWSDRPHEDEDGNPLADAEGNPLGIICATYSDVQLVDDVRAQPILERFTDFVRGSPQHRGQGDVLYFFTRTGKAHPLEPMLDPMLAALRRVAPDFREQSVVQTFYGHAPSFYGPGPLDTWRLQTSGGDRILLVGVAAQQYSGLTGCGFGPAARNFGRMAQLIDAALRSERLAFADLARIDIDVRERYSQAIIDTFGGTMAVTANESDITPNTDWLIFCQAALEAGLTSPELGEVIKDKLRFSSLRKMTRMVARDPRVATLLFENNPRHEVNVVWTILRSALGLLVEEVRLALSRGDAKYRRGTIDGSLTLPGVMLDASRIGGGRAWQRFRGRSR